MLEAITLGIIQGIVEWLPVSSEGVLFLVKTNIFKSQQGFEEIIRQILFLHFGTFLAALIYFRKDLGRLLKALFSYQSAIEQDKRLVKFLVVTTLITGILGFFLIKMFSGLDRQVENIGQIATLAIGLLLLTTAVLQLKASKRGSKEIKDLTNKDNWLLGVVQGLAVLPGLSRSGLTISVLLLRKFDNASALKLSFLMSLPIVLVGNIMLNLKHLVFSMELVLGLVFSFVFGWLTINFLLKLAGKINFGYFVFAFAILVIASVFISML